MRTVNVDLRDRCARYNCQMLIKKFPVSQNNWKLYKPFCSYHCQEWAQLENAQAYIDSRRDAASHEAKEKP